MTSDDFFLARIATALSSSDDTLGVVVHGSYATASHDTRSDVDIIWVSRSDQKTARFVRLVDDIKVDIYAASCAQIYKSINADIRDNNNFVLYAFVRGHSLIDRNGSVAELTSAAHRLWAQGPATPGQEERERIQAVSGLTLEALDRLGARALRSPQWREMALLHSGRLFVDCFYAYCRINRLWSSAIWEMLRWTDPKYKYLLSVTRTYLNKRSLQARLHAIQQLAGSIVSISSRTDDQPPQPTDGALTSPDWGTNVLHMVSNGQSQIDQKKEHAMKDKRTLTSSEEEKLRDIERQAREASLSGDCKFFDALMADDYLGIDPRGRVTNKAQALESRSAGTVRYHSITADDVRIRMYGNIAIVTGCSHVKGQEKGKETAGDYRYTRVYLRQQGRWQTVSSQSTGIYP
jgi:ketosteroid isomerase-like protein